MDFQKRRGYPSSLDPMVNHTKYCIKPVPLLINPCCLLPSGPSHLAVQRQHPPPVGDQHQGWRVGTGGGQEVRHGGQVSNIATL